MHTVAVPRPAPLSALLSNATHLRGGFRGADAVDAARRSQLRVGIATFLFNEGREGRATPGVDRSRGCKNIVCVVPMWCVAARRLKEALPHSWRSELLLMSNDRECYAMAARECAELELVSVEDELRAAVAACEGRCASHHPKARSPHGCRERYWTRLFRWQFWALTQYDAIVLTDLDVDFMPSSLSAWAVGARWARALPLLVQSSVKILASPVAGSPLMAGQMVILPSRRLYADGLSVLRSCQFSVRRGWQDVGSPSEGAANLYARACTNHSALGAVVAQGAACRRQLAIESFGRFADGGHAPPAAKDHWNFVGASSDQGFLLYMLYVRHALGAIPVPIGAAHSRAAAERAHERAHEVVHYWGTRKAYLKPAHWLSAVRKPYLHLQCSYAFLRRLPLPRMAPTACTRELRDYLRLLEALPNFAAPSKLSKNCSRYTVAGSAAGGGTCRYPDVVRQVLL